MHCLVLVTSTLDIIIYDIISEKSYLDIKKYYRVLISVYSRTVSYSKLSCEGKISRKSCFTLDLATLSLSPYLELLFSSGLVFAFVASQLSPRSRLRPLIL